SRDCSCLTTSEIRRFCSRLIRSVIRATLAAPFIYGCRRIGGCEYCRGSRESRRIPFLAAGCRSHFILACLFPTAAVSLLPLPRTTRRSGDDNVLRSHRGGA